MAEIVINDIEPLNQYTAAGGEPSFDYDFPIFDKDDLKALQITDTGVVSTLVEGTDFTLSGVGNADGGTMTFDLGVYPSGATADYRYTLYRDRAISRGTDFLTGGDFKASTVNKELDKIIMMLQQNERDIARKIGLKIEDAEDEISLVVETAANRASKLLQFGTGGDTIQGVEIASLSLTGLDTLFTSLTSGDLFSWNGTNWVNISQITAAHLPTDTITPVKVDTSVNAIGSIGGGTQDIDLDDGRSVTATVDTSTTTFTFSNPKSTGNEDIFTLTLTNGGSQTVNWPSSVDWPGGNAPTLTTSGKDEFAFRTTDGGTNWSGAYKLDVK